MKGTHKYYLELSFYIFSIKWAFDNTTMIFFLLNNNDITKHIILYIFSY